MEQLIKSIDEDFLSSPVDGVCVLSINDWQTLKTAVLAQQTNNSQSDTIALLKELHDTALLCSTGFLYGKSNLYKRINAVLAQQHT